MHPMESIICEALTGTTNKDISICRVSCNAVASQSIFCECGNILDQKTITVVTVKTPKRRVIQGFCTKCWIAKKPDIMEAAEVTQTPILIENWNGVEFQQGTVE